MRRAARIDDNQAEIINALRQMGCTVQSLAACGYGVPDVLAAFRGRNVLLEIKDPKKPKADRMLTPAQVKWHQNWRGQVTTIYTIDEAIAVVIGGDRE
ncbi:MAG: hypothetical protein H0W40_19345 [Methylibium sp.]|uniref:hypothetical protein n=1 Tax=Methylibium sp. TaxID=2067992 RepID=UPI0018104461|nr:hypothetical protein [Methylibium sp.]MBA3599501.1 hypothetical protein [Methylibium sp.]